MKKKDFIIIGVIIVIALGALGLFYMGTKTQTRLMVRIRQNNTLLKTISLDTDYEETLSSELGSNQILLKDQQVWVEDADCDNQICVNSAAINTPGETIACLPHKLIIEVIQE